MQPASTPLENEPQQKLGMKFWVMWGVGMLALSAAFSTSIWWISPGMRTTTGVLIGGAVVLVFTVALIAGGMIPQRIRQKRGLEGRMRPPYRRYIQRFMPAMFGYVILLLAAITYARDASPTGALAVIVAAAPAIPLLFAIRAIFLLPREEDDEYQRDRIYRAYAWATGATLAACTVWGFLDMFAVVPHAEMWIAFPMWSLFMGLARCLPSSLLK